MMHIQNVDGGYTKTPILKEIDLTIQKGEFFVLLGPNGSGKTTLFKLITGQLPIQKGNVFLSGKNISSYSKLAKAKKIAVLSQEVSISFDFTVEEIVRLGRYPHQKGFLKNLSKKDQQIIEEVMELTRVSEFREKQFRTISGGEKQRVLLAKALAQEPELLLLDEPTNHLDIKHTFELLNLLKERQQLKGLTIFAILHDLNVASLFADRFALLQNGRIVDVGDVDLLKKEKQLQHVYNVQVSAQSHPTVPKPQLLMTPNISTGKKISVDQSFQIYQTEDSVHVECEQLLRTMSNGLIGDGIQWNQHFCQFYVESDKQSSKEELQKRMECHEIPSERTAGIMSVGNLQELIIVSEQQMKVIVSIVENSEKKKTPQYTVHVMVFIDSHFTDGELVNSYLTATEATVSALKELKWDFSIQTGCITLAVTQQEDQAPHIKMNNVMKQAVYKAAKKAIQKQFLSGVK